MRILEIPVANVANITELWDTLKVYRAASYTGTYSVLSRTAPLAGNRSVYTYVDPTGDSTHYYKFTYYDSTSVTAESSQFPVVENYCQISDLKERLNDGTNNQDDMIFFQNARAATDQVRRYCRRHFEWKTETRYFEGPNFHGSYDKSAAARLFVDDLVSVSSLQVDYSGGRTGATLTTFTIGTEAYLWPQDAPNLEEPYQGLAFVPGANIAVQSLVPNAYQESLSMGPYWPQGYQAIRVTGVWGWPVQALTNSSIPADVQEATLQIAAKLYKGKDNAYSRVVGNAQLGTQTVMDALLSADTKALLAPYRRILHYGA